MIYPDFLVIGAPRSGTTSLYSYLNQHPQIQMSSQKEAGFFHFAGEAPDFDRMAISYGPDLLAESRVRYKRAERLSILDAERYGQLWTPDSMVTARGEATPTYLFDPEAASVIRRHVPNSKLIVMLRNPADRAYSEYLQALRLGLEQHRDFEDALAAEPVDVDDYWWGARRYVRSGLYAKNLTRYLDTWPRERIRIYFNDQFEADTPSLVRDCFQFLGVDENVAVDVSTRHKAGFVPAQSLLVAAAQSDGVIKRSMRKVLPWSVRRRLYHRIVSRSKAEPPPFSDRARSSLITHFSEDISRLQALTGRDLRVWLRP
jgi:hypothetical protein